MTGIEEPRWLRADSGDDDDFAAFVEALIDTLATEVQTVFVLRIDNWFGPKWLGFTAKVAGAVSARRALHAPTVVPPFKPSRIVSERRFVRDDQHGFDEYKFSDSLHRKQTSAENLGRKLSHISDDALFVWFSGNTLKNGRGSILVAATPGVQADAWYAGLERGATGWRIAKSAGSVPITTLLESMHRGPIPER